MTTNTERAGFINPVPGLSGLRRFGAKVVHAIAEFGAVFAAAQTVARQADRYYAMNDAQLAKAGLTRDQIPAELIRRLSR